MNCISCNNEHDNEYCPNCGEKRDVKNITFLSILQGTFNSIMNMDKGFLYNVKHLLIAPKKITTDFINGKRKGIFNPISFFVISITIYFIIQSYFKFTPLKTETILIKDFLSYKIGKQGGLFIQKYFKFFWVFSIFIFGLISKLFFKKFTYLEHVTIGAFLLGETTLFVIIPYLFFKINLIFNPFLYLILFWLTYRVFKIPKNNIESFFLTFTVILFYFLLLFISIIVIGYLSLMYNQTTLPIS